MEILPIGIYGPYPAAGGATSCYLVRGETGNVVLDLGSGALSALMRRVDVADVDAFLLTHLHYDHFVDALALSYVPGRNALPRSSLRHARGLHSFLRPRGVVMREGETLDELIAERAPYYERYADFTVDEHGGIEDTVAEVTEIARSFLGR